MKNKVGGLQLSDIGAYKFIVMKSVVVRMDEWLNGCMKCNWDPDRGDKDDWLTISQWGKGESFH